MVCALTLVPLSGSIVTLPNSFPGRRALGSGGRLGGYGRRRVWRHVWLVVSIRVGIVVGLGLRAGRARTIVQIHVIRAMLGIWVPAV